MISANFPNLKKVISNSDDKFDILKALPARWLEEWHIYDFAFNRLHNGISIYALIAIDEPIDFPIPDCENVHIVFGKNTIGGKISLFDLAIVTSVDSFQLAISRLQVSIQFDLPFLKPVDSSALLEVVSEVSFKIDSENRIEIEPAVSFSLAPCYIGDSGVIVRAEEIKFSYLNDKPIFTLEEAELILPSFFNIPQGIEILFNDCRISKRGFSGTCVADVPIGAGGKLFGVSGGIHRVEFVIENSMPLKMDLRAKMLLPFFSEEIGVKLLVDNKDNINIEVDAAHEVISFDFGKIEFSGGLFRGHVRNEDFHIDGEAHTVVVELPGLQIQGSLLKTRIEKLGKISTFTLDIEEFKLGTLGTLRKGSLVITIHEDVGSYEVKLLANAQWTDFKARMQLADVFGASTIQDNDVHIAWHWLSNPDDSVQADVEFSININDISGLWSFIPVRLRPTVKNLSLCLTTSYKDVNEFATADEDEAIVVDGSVRFDFKLPEALQLPPNEVIVIHSGNDDGYMSASLTVTLVDDEQKVSAVVENPVSIEMHFPGLKQDDAPIQVSFDSLSFNAAVDDHAEIGEINMEGTFRFLLLDLPVNIPFSSSLERLLSSFTSAQVAGKARYKLAFKDGRVSSDIVCIFDNTSVEVDLFDLIANLARGMEKPGEIMARDEQTIDIDIPFSFGLKGFSLQLGSLSDHSTAEQFRFSIDYVFSILDVKAQVAMMLSDKECNIGFKTFEVPLGLPKFPLKAADLVGLNSKTSWTRKIEDLDGDIASNGSNSELKIKRALLATAFSIRSKLTDEASRNDYEALLIQVVTILDAVSGVMHVDTKAKLLIKDAVLKIPYSDPRGISIQGGATLTGFAKDDKLKCLEGVELGLGLSADRIYFFSKALGTPIPVNIGSYEAGSVSFTEFSIGYGFLKNSFSVAFSGKVQLSRRLQEDADVSDAIGFGIRLPKYSAIAFRLDLIPIPGPIPVVPYLDFNFDLRTPGLPAINNAHICSPNWDGLQFIIHDVVHIAFRQVSFSPTLGVLPVPNIGYAYDYTISNHRNGATVMCNNFFVPMGIYVSPQLVPIPVFIDPGSPYFDNLCVHIHIAGFTVNFHLQRPLPQFNPLAVFEMLGLLSDPMMPVDTNGALANMVKVAITDTYIKCPDYITKLAPGLLELNKVEVNYVLNAGTVISAFQQIAAQLRELQETLEHSKKHLEDKLNHLQKAFEEPLLDKLIALIPPELRRMRFETELGGFQASLLVVIMDANDTRSLKEAFKNRQNKASQPNVKGFKLRKIGEKVTPEEVIKYKPTLKLDTGQQFYDPSVGTNDLFRSAHFDNFTEEDIRALPLHPKGMPGVIAGGFVRIFSQRYQFLGILFEDGSYSLISTIEIEPLKLSVAGIVTQLGFQCVGRIKLTGRDRFRAAIAVGGFANWEAIPGMLNIAIGTEKDPVRVDIDNYGKFKIRGNARALLYNGLATLNGSIDVSDVHCLINGNFDFNPKVTINSKDLLHLAIEGMSNIGPGNQFEMSGAASLSILGENCSDVKAVVANDRIALEYLLSQDSMFFMNQVFQFVDMNMRVKGELNYSNFNNAGFSFQGNGDFAIKNPVSPATNLFKANGQVVLDYSLVNGIGLKCFGKVKWYGMNWFGGGIEFNRLAIKVFGSTKMSIPVTSAQISSLAIDLAHIVFNIELAGTIVLNSDSTFTMNVNGSWLLGISGAASNTNCFPIASQQIGMNTDAGMPSIKLIDFKGLDYLPASDLLDFNVFVPGISSSKIDLYRGEIGGLAVYSPLKLFPDWTFVSSVPLPDFFKRESININLASIIKDIGNVSAELRCDNWRPYLHVVHGGRSIRINI